MKIVVVGRSGQVAWELQHQLAPLGSITCLGRPEFDLTEPESLCSAVRGLQPDVLINAAAYTAVDQAESEPEAAMKANAEAPALLAEEAKRVGALFITYSSDYVFDGEKTAPYNESDKPNPVNVYGASKLAGDRAVEAIGGAYLIFRTSWVYGSRGKNFLNTILRLAAERKELKIVDDQVGAPTWSREIARATGRIIAQLAETDLPAGSSLAEKVGARSGIYNMAAAGSVSWCGFAQAIRKEAGIQMKGRTLAQITPIPASQYPLPARRPYNSRLAGEKLRQTFGIELPAWQQSLACVVRELSEPAQVFHGGRQ